MIEQIVTRRDVVEHAPIFVSRLSRAREVTHAPIMSGVLVWYENRREIRQATR